MICTSIQNKDFKELLQVLETCEMAEVRLDKCRLSLSQIAEVFASDVPLVATCRLGDLPLMKVQQKLEVAAEAGAKYVDVEIEAPKQMSKAVRAAAHENGAVFIRSYHNFEMTPSLDELTDIMNKCLYHGADVVKIVTTANSPEDVETVMALYDRCEKPGRLIAFCMGELGRQSRMDCLAKGAPYTYAALTDEEATAPGQWTQDEMREALYGDFSFAGCDESLTMPCSKSFAQRAVVAAALADGESVLTGYSPCGDNESALAVARSLGATVDVDGSTVKIQGVGAKAASMNLETLHVGESGLLTRMMMPLAAQLAKGLVTLTGEKTLLSRPLKGAGAIMSSFGVEVPEDCVIPVTVRGPLSAGKVQVSGKHGSQLITGLLMATPLSEKHTTISVVEPKSIPYMFITLDVMKRFGIRVANDMLGGRDFIESGGDWALCNELIFKVKPGQSFKPANLYLEGDWSAAANFLVAGAVFGKLSLKGLDTTSLQADLSIMDILMEAGASLSQLDGKDGEILVQRAPLNAFEVDAVNCPDLFPIISVLAAFCCGTSRISGVSRLVHKESNRAEAIVNMLTQMGVKVNIEDDTLVVEGESLQARLLNGRLLKGGQYTSCHDHRMVMALRVASLGADSPIEIDDMVCVEKSFPQFHELFEKLM